jgi:hypothetical protein
VNHLPPPRPYGYTTREWVINAEHSLRHSQRRRERERKRKLRNLILWSVTLIVALGAVLAVQGGPT